MKRVRRQLYSKLRDGQRRRLGIGVRAQALLFHARKVVRPLLMDAEVARLALGHAQHQPLIFRLLELHNDRMRVEVSECGGEDGGE